MLLSLLLYLLSLGAGGARPRAPLAGRALMRLRGHRAGLRGDYIYIYIYIHTHTYIHMDRTRT